MARNIFKQALIVFSVSFFSFLLSYHGKAQTSISGIVNSYIDVTAIIDADELTVSDTSAFSVGDTVLLIQMKGLAINNSSDPDYFGQRQQTYSAGKYEIIIIASISGDDITFANDMTNSYDANGHMQMVRVPGYDNAIVTDNITCPVWDTVTGTGGVVAMIVGNKLTLEADIDVTGKGFEGAEPNTTSDVLCTTNNDSYFPAGSDSAGYKGEGIASYALDNTNPLNGIYAKGRGSYFNGGGGGNGKYSGGGGGANGGSGGGGGKQWEPCGINPGGGLGGRAIPNEMGSFDTDNLIFMGGAGGASTQLNDGDGTAGGNGGGIIIILADTIIGNGNTIKANGETVVDITNNTGGAGGGGAGGTILLDVKGYKGSTLNVQALGGNGGWSGAVAGNCTGPGGGGGGGIVWYSQAIKPAEISLEYKGGAAGSNSCALWGQSEGSQGTTVTNLKVPLTGFLFNSIFSIRTEALYDTICEEDYLPKLLGTSPRGGISPYEYRWERSNDNSTWIIDLDYGAGGQDYNPPTEIYTTYYRRTVKDSSVPPIVDTSKAVTIIVQPKIEQNSLSFDTIICQNQTPNLIIPEFLSPIGGDGIYSYLWEQGTDADGIIFADAPDVNNTDTYQPPALTVAQTYYYRRTVYSGKCSHISDTVTITVLPSISNNTISADQTICEGSVFLLLDGAGPADGNGTYTYQWIESTDGNTWGDAYGPGINEDYSPDTTSLKFPGTLFFKRVVYSGLSNCCVDTSNKVTLVDWTKLGNNSINTNQVICEGDDPVAISGLTPTGGNGAYTYQWQERSGVAAWSDIGLGAVDYDPSNLSDTTFYRRVVDSDVCTDTSIIDTIPVHPAISNNDIFTLGGSSDTTICEGALPNSLAGTQPAGGIGAYSFLWKESTDGSSWVANGTNNIDYVPGNLTVTTFYKREVFSGACTDMSGVIDINVLPALGDNSISTNQTICYNTIPAKIDGVLPTGGNSVYTYQWEESTDNIVWNPASGTDNEQNYQSEALSIPKFFRRVIFSGAVDCCSDTSNVVLVSINPLPTGVLTNLVDTICKGSNVALTVNLTGAPPWDLTYSDGTTSFNKNNISNTSYNFNVSPSSTSNYTLDSLTDDNGCSATSLTGTADITVYEVPVANAGADDEICELVYTFDAVPSVGSGLWTYPAVPVSTATDNTQAQNQVILSDYGTYTFIWTESNWNCIDSDDVEIIFWESPTHSEAGADQLLSSYAKETLLEGNVPLVGVGEWTKLPSESIIEDPFEPGTRVTNLISGEYEFVWTITNGVCPEESDAVKITVNSLFIPSGFSPNSDEINDFFEIKGINDVSNELIIINSGGNEVYRQKNYQNDWDGTYKTGEELPDGTYYYIFYIYDTDKPREESGFVVIKR